MSFSLLPQEIKDQIYEEHFRGILIRPDVQAAVNYIPEEQKRKRFNNSRLALLLLSKSQCAHIRRALLKDVMVLLKNSLAFAAFLLMDSDVHDAVRTLIINFLPNRYTPRSLVGKVLRATVRLSTIEIRILNLDYYLSFNFHHSTLIAEASSASSAFRNSLGRFLDRGYDTASKWLYSALSPESFGTTTARESTSPRILIRFPIKSTRCSVRESTWASRDLTKGEVFDIPATFDSQKWSVEFCHEGQQFSIPQVPLQEMVGGRFAARSFATHAIVADLPGDVRVKEVIDTHFQGLSPTPASCLAMHRDIDHYSSPNAGYKVRRAYKIGHALLGIQEATHPHSPLPGDPLERRALRRDKLWDLWRRVLDILDEKLLAKEWKDSYDVAEALLNVYKRRPRGMDKSQQYVFFAKRWDVEPELFDRREWR